MSASGFTPISIYYSTTASAVPTAANLVPGELAINTADGKLYYEDSSGVVQVLATKSTGSIGGSNTQVQFNNSGSLGGSSGLTWDGSFLTTSSIKNSALTSGRVTYAGASGLLSDSANLQFNSNGLGIGAAPNTSPGSPYYNLNVGTQGGGGIISAGTDVYFTNNLYIAGNNYFAWTGGSAYASYYNQTGGNHTWKSSTAAGTGGNVATLTDLMTLKFNGNLGIGTSSPNAKLQVTSSAFPVLKVADAIGGGALALGDEGTNNNYVGIWRGAANSISGGGFLNVQGNGIAFMSSDNVFGSASERMRIDSSGTLLVGATTSGVANGGIQLNPAGNGAGMPFVGSCGNTSSDAQVTFGVFSTSASQYQFYVGYGGTVYARSLVISSLSDARLKENIVDLDVGLDKVMALKPRKFDWKEGQGTNKKNVRGFIAQELEQVFPDLIDEWRDPAPEGEEPYRSVRQDLIPVLVKAIQEQQALIESLTTRLTNLENK